MCEDVKVLIMHIGGYPDRYSKKGLFLIKDVKPNLFISGNKFSRIASQNDPSNHLPLRQKKNCVKIELQTRPGF